MRTYATICATSFWIGILFSSNLVPDLATYSKGFAYTDPLNVAIIALADPLNNFDPSLLRIRVLLISLTIVSSYFLLVEQKIEGFNNPRRTTLWFITLTAMVFSMLHTTITNFCYCGVPFW